MKRLILLVLGCIGLLPQASDAQQLPLFTQYRENISVINPAAVSHDYLVYENNVSYGASYRRQWVGLDSGPRTQTVRGEYIFTELGSFGLAAGLYLMNDKTGPTGFTGIYGRLAGIITDGDPYYGGLSIGLAFGAVQYRVNVTDIKLRDPGDIVGMDDQAQIYPDAGLGIYYYKLISDGFLEDSHIYGGLSVPQIIGLNLEFEDETGNFYTQRVQHFYGTVGLYKYLDEGFIEPSIWVKYAPNVPLNIDFNLRYQLAGNFWIGAGGSTSGAMHLEGGLLMGENMGFDNTLKIGYGFGYSFTTFGPSAGTTHEINLSYSLSTY